MPAQGNALGLLGRKDKALKGRAMMSPPLQGFDYFVADIPGRCPVLACGAPLMRRGGPRFNVHDKL
jgi:hypothetical protein